MKCDEVIFDSEIDSWSRNNSTLNDKIIRRKHLVFLIEDEDGERFGYYLNTKVLNNFDEGIPSDEKSFHFNLFSNGRLSEPMKFEANNKNNSGYNSKSYKLFNKTCWTYLIRIGFINICKQENKHYSKCIEFDNKGHHSDKYDSIINTLCGKSVEWNDEKQTCIGAYFVAKKIIVIQMI